MKKIAGLNERLLTLSEEEVNEKMPTRRSLLLGIGNTKMDTADDSRRVRRILMKIRAKDTDTLALENDDLNFLEKHFEKNPAGLPSWFQGQILDLLASAEKIELEIK